MKPPSFASDWMPALNVAAPLLSAKPLPAMVERAAAVSVPPLTCICPPVVEDGGAR
jgi:hypothetical protein